MDYKPKRRRWWSKALVRHGADPQKALAAVLRVAAQDIQIREGAGPKRQATANTAPSPHPNNPNPNTDPLAQPSTAEPGSPSGDN